MIKTITVTVVCDGPDCTEWTDIMGFDVETTNENEIEEALKNNDWINHDGFNFCSEQCKEGYEHEGD